MEIAQVAGAPQLIVWSCRGPVVDSQHYGHIVVSNREGKLVYVLGDSDISVVLRSAAKPIQALSVVTSGAAQKFGLTSKELAICCGSHSGSSGHVSTVDRMLKRMGLEEADLLCGSHWPSDNKEFDRLKQADKSPSPLHNNCSGKHAGMLAATLAMEASPTEYLHTHHPIQVLIRKHLTLLSGLSEDEFETATDGCGVPTYALPLRSIATAITRLALPQQLPAHLQSAAVQIARAMNRHPDMVQCAGSFNTELLRAGRGCLIAKGGAEGIFVLGLINSGLGIAIKVADGASRAWPPIILALLSRVVELEQSFLDRFAQPEIRNHHGDRVGHLEAAPVLREVLP